MGRPRPIPYATNADTFSTALAPARIEEDGIEEEVRDRPVDGHLPHPSAFPRPSPSGTSSRGSRSSAQRCSPTSASVISPISRSGSPTSVRHGDGPQTQLRSRWCVRGCPILRRVGLRVERCSLKGSRGQGRRPVRSFRPIRFTPIKSGPGRKLAYFPVFVRPSPALNTRIFPVFSRTRHADLAPRGPVLKCVASRFLRWRSHDVARQGRGGEERDRPGLALR